MKRFKVLSVFAALTGLLLLTSMASAINLPEYMEFDLDNWTRLYRQGDPVPEGTAPLPGDMSRAFITLNDIAPTVGPGGADLPPVWVAGLSDGTYLHGWEDNVVILPVAAGLPTGGVVLQGDGSVNLYFGHDADPTNFEFAVYQNTVTTLDFIYNDPNFLNAGPTQFNAIQANLAAVGAPFVRGNFADSVYFDPALALAGYDEGFGPGYITAVAAINVPTGGAAIGGEWVNQVNLPYMLGVNAFVDIDQTWGIGDQFQQDFYGFGVASGVFFWDNTDPYDMAIQNVRLNSEIGPPNLDGQSWIISDDGIRAGEFQPIPEPATMLLLGTGLVGLAGTARRRRNKKQA